MAFRDRLESELQEEIDSMEVDCSGFTEDDEGMTCTISGNEIEIDLTLSE